MKKVLIPVIIIVLVICGVFAFLKLDTGSKTLSSGELESVLEDASDLTTQKLCYQGYVKQTSGSIPLINKNEFIVLYEADVLAGIDVQDVEFDITDELLLITIPHSEIQSVSVEMDKVKVEDTNFSVIRANKEAMVDALKVAEKDAKKNAKKSGLLEAADVNAKNLIKGLFLEVAGDRTVKVEFK